MTGSSELGIRHLRQRLYVATFIFVIAQQRPTRPQAAFFDFGSELLWPPPRRDFVVAQVLVNNLMYRAMASHKLFIHLLDSYPPCFHVALK